MPDKRDVVQDWFARGEDDLNMVRIAFPAGGPAATSAFLLQQAAEKYLKGYLISKGWRLRKTHSLTALIEVAVNYDASFGNYANLAHLLTAFYVESRYPGQAETKYSREEVARILEQTEKLISKIRDSVEH
ncbi:MAG: HEPN domain-containing protein [Chloroflexi bacterium]|nr:HEPN domain-containing protein [Chloroflexota bacterium]